MKQLFFSLILLFSFSANAQSLDGLLDKINGMDISQVQGELIRVAACMQDVDQAKMKQLEKRGKAIMQRVETLCEAGKAKEAERYSKHEIAKIMREPTARKLKSCAGNLIEVLGGLPVLSGNSDEPICG